MNRFDHLLCWAASAIAPAEGHQQFGVDILLPVMLPGCFHVVGIDKSVIVVMILDGFTGSGKEHDQYLRPVEPAPVKRIVGKSIELAPMNGGAGEIIHAALLHELRD